MSKPLAKPRSPSYTGTETTSWGSVSKSFAAFLKAYYKHHPDSKTASKPSSFKECPKAIKNWMAGHSILGNADSDDFSTGVVLPVVNPMTGKLNGGGVRSALAYAGRVGGVSKGTIEATKKMLAGMYKRNFGKSAAIENLIDILETLDELESKREILALVRKDPYMNQLLNGLDDAACVTKLEDLLGSIDDDPSDNE